MDILHLTYFIEVAKQESFTKAAQTLYVSQPSISKVIKSLEDELGVILFERTRNKVILTDAGQAVYARAKRVVLEFDNLTSELSEITGIQKGKVVIGLPPMVGAKFFPKIIGLFKQQYPGIQIKLIEVGSKQIELGVDDGSLDAGVVALPVNTENFEVFPFVKEPLKVVLHNHHPLAKHPYLTLSSLQQEALIFYNEFFSLHDLILKKCKELSFTPNIICQSSQWDLIVEMVAAELGIALLPATVCRDLAANCLTTVPLHDPVIPWHLAIIWKKNKYQSFAAREWLKFAIDFHSPK